MSMWVKICANTNVEDAQFAAECGADAVGFVFAPSKRHVDAEQVAGIVAHLPASLEKIGVFGESDLEEIARAVETAGLTGVQLHFDAPRALVAGLRERFGAKLRIVRTVQFVVGGAAPSLAGVEGDANIDAILVDSKTASASGGTGKIFDWGQAAATLFQRSERKMIAAGGLTPENVAEAIRILRPWGVDVASGVEAASGRKDAAKVRAFIENARRASH